MPVQPTMVQLSAEDRDMLAEAATREGISRSEVVRRALRAYLAEDVQSQISERIRQGYIAVPESDEELVPAIEGAKRLLTDPDLPW